ncbi:MAG: site-2 protease family protein [Planctomycetes bacterium]|nr:site-2 protease family protein [Planctomycetota bacterium]
MDNSLLVDLLVIALVIYSVSLHELAHAYSATLLGDPTPGRAGRLTFNPLAQLLPTPLISIVFPILLYLTQGNLFCIAFCPTDPSRFRRPLRDSALVAFAGPATNFLMMGLFLGVLWIPGTCSTNPEHPTYNQLILLPAAYWNMVLGVFNLLPLPALDGYDMMRGLLPLRLRRPLDDFRRMRFLPLLVAFLLGPHLLGFVMKPLLHFFFMLVPG